MLRVNRKSRSATFAGVFLMVCVSAIGLTGGAQNTTASQSGVGNITVKVTGDGGRPLPGAGVFLLKTAGGTTNDDRGVTNENGEHIFTDVPTGRYSVSAYYYGYTQIGIENLTEHSRGASGVIPGDSVVFKFTKGGVITGRVTDQSGEPLVAMNVRAVLVRDSNGRQGTGASYNGQTDDRGIYRIFGMYVGSYIVSVSGKQYPGRFTSNPYYDSLPTYYPSTNRSGAKEVAVTLGGEASGIDIMFGPTMGHTISGKIVNSIWGPNENVSVSLSQIDARYNNQSIPVGIDTPDHLFQFTAVEDGEYEIAAYYYPNGGQAARGKAQRFKVKGDDVTGIILTLTPTASIAGKVIFEATPPSGQSASCSQKPSTSLSEVTIGALKDDHGDIESAGWPAAAPSEDGEFLIRNIDPGRYAIGAVFRNDDLYISSIVDARGRPVGARSGSSKTLSDLSPLVTVNPAERGSGIVVKLAHGAANIEGRLESGGGGSIAMDSFRVYLLPAENDFVNDVSRYRENSVRENGRFAILNLAPGKYWIVAVPTPKKGDQSASPGQFTFDNSFRAMIRKLAETKGTQLDLKPCYRNNDLSLKVQ